MYKKINQHGFLSAPTDNRMKRLSRNTILYLFCLIGCSPLSDLRAQDFDIQIAPPAFNPLPAVPTQTSQTATPIPTPQPTQTMLALNEQGASPASNPPLHSDAQQIAELQESLESDQEQLLKLEAEMDNPQSEYAMAEREYRMLNDQLEQIAKQLEAAKADRAQAIYVPQLESERASLARRCKLAQDRFDLAIEDRKTLKDQRTTLKRKIENDRNALAQLTGESPNGEQDESPNEPRSDDARPPHRENNDSSHLSHREKEAGEGDNESNSHSKDHIERSENDEKSTSDANGEQEEVDEELMEAQAEAEKKEAEAEEAQEETKSLAARLSDLQGLISQEQKELTLAKKKVDLATATQQQFNEELSRRQTEGADAEEISSLKNSISQANQRLITARADVSEISERLNEHRAEFGSLQSEHIVALHEAAKKKQEADNAENRIEELRNPYTVRNITQWLIEHGPRLLIIVLGMFLINRVASMFAFRSVQLVSKGSNRGTTAERENRAKTLVGVFQNAATVGIFVTGIIMVLEEIGANITVLMGGVAVIGLAVAFGAQNLIKDYFYGFVMLLENQYMLNDTVRIGGVTGQVERITLRMTVLRDSSGVVHFIPNGTINSVSNETHGWSRAVCEVNVGYDEDLDRVVEILRGISSNLSSAATIQPLLLEKPSEPAIECLGESTITLKMSAKTLPNKHGAVKQEWLRLIRKTFTEQGIEPPYRQQAIRVFDRPSREDEVDTANDSSDKGPIIRYKRA